MKTLDRLCVAVGVALAAWGGMVHTQTVDEARIVITRDTDEGIHTAWDITRNGTQWYVAGGLLLASFGLTGPRRAPEAHRPTSP